MQKKKKKRFVNIYFFLFKSEQGVSMVLKPEFCNANIEQLYFKRATQPKISYCDEELFFYSEIW